MQLRPHWRHLCSVVPLVALTVLAFVGATPPAHAQPTGGAPDLGNLTPAIVAGWMETNNYPIVSVATVVPTPSNLDFGPLDVGDTILAPNCYQPTAAIVANPLALTDAQIAQYGFPPKQDFTETADTLAQWVSIVQHSLHRSCLGTRLPDPNAGPGSTNKATVAAKANNEHYITDTTNWYGYEQNENTPAYWQNIVMEYYQPSPQALQDLCNTDTKIYEWGGLSSSFSGGPLVQSGTIVDNNQNCTSKVNTTYYQAFVESPSNTTAPYYGTPFIIDFTDAVAPGDDMESEVLYSYGGTSAPDMVINDLTQSEYSGNYTYGPQPGNHAAECEGEAPTGYGGDPLYLTDSYVNQCYMEDSNGYHHPMGVNEFAWYNINWGPLPYGWATDPPCVSSCSGGLTGTFTLKTWNPTS